MHTKLCIAFLAATQFCVLCTSSARAWAITQPAAPDAQAHAEAQHALSWLARAGMSTEVLCAAGVEGPQRAAMAQAAIAAMRAASAQLQAADEELTLAREELRAAQTATGLTVQARREAMSAAQLRWRNASAAVAVLEHAAREAVLAPLSDQLRALLRTAHANASRQTPVIYKFQARDDAGWSRLERALRAKRSAEASNQPASALTLTELSPASHATFIEGASQRLNNLESYALALVADLTLAAQ